MTDFRLPDLGEGLDEAEIVSWHAGVGDRVVADQPLVAVETAKAVVEIPSPCSGRIAKRYGEPGDILKVGDPLVAFAETDQAADREDAATVVGRIPPATHAEPPSPPAAGHPVSRASPAVRRRAKELGIDLATITPSGTHGEITMGDLATRAGGEEGTGLIRPLRGPRRTMARNMALSRDQVVPATLHDDADVEHWTRDIEPTLRLARAVAAACRVEPILNASLDAEEERLRIHDSVDLGIAVDTEQGLFVPVLRDVGNRTEEDLRAGLERLQTDVRSRSIPPHELRGATITLSNFGTLGGQHGALVVLPPQVAIIGAGRIASRVVASGETIVVHRLLPLSLTFDHRAVTGGEAARFLAAVKADLES